MPGDQSERLRAARINAGFASASEAAQRFGWGESAYRHHENGTRNFGADAAKRYGRAFRVKPGWLLGLDYVNNPAFNVVADAADQLEVNGSVCAGVWRESEHWDDDRRFVINLPSPVPGAQRFGMLVEGYSMDLLYEPGTVLDCVSIFSKAVTPQPGDVVIVERSRPEGLRELTVKEYREEDGRQLLVPRSSRSEFQPLVYPGPDATADPDTHETVRIIAFVVTAYPPQALDLLARMGLVSRPGPAAAR